MYFSKLLLFIGIGLSLACGAGGMGDDLFPSGKDERPSVSSGGVGSQVGQVAPVYSKSNTKGEVVTLADDLNPHEALVLYFTMWCPVCDTHMGHLRSSVRTQYPKVQFNFVDYVSGSVELARQSQMASGYGDFQTLVDDNNSLLSSYHGTMGTVVVVGPSGNILLNESYKNGSRVLEVLESLSQP
jgi:peroxiredoxin